MIATDNTTLHNIAFTPEARRLLKRVYGDSVAAYALCNAYSPATAHQHERRRAVAHDAFGAAGARRLRLALARSPHVTPGVIGNEQYLVNLA